MEIKSEVVVDDGDHVQLPPGFRFHPTDEELITHYLSNKVRDPRFSTAAIGEADMNKIEPWDLPWKAKLGEKEWYFFCVKDKKYPSGVRTNRATAAGYWKATGKDREIFRGKSLVGMKKTLVFYKGRAPKGEKSNWVAHEYRLEGDFSLQKLPQSTRNEWVISRVFQKTCGGKKIHISEMKKSMDFDGISTMPPLIDSTKLELEPEPDHGHVHCFSRATVAPHKIQQDFIITDPISPSSSNPLDESFSKPQFPPLIQNEIVGFCFCDLYSSSSEFYSFEEI